MNWKAAVAAGAIAFAGVATIASGSESGSSSSDEGSSSSSEEQTSSSTGRDGNFEFDLNSIECGSTSVGEEPLGAKAQGEFCIATVKVSNIGKESQTFDASSQKALNGDVELDADSTASLYANDGGQSFLEKINPGNSVTVKIVYDVPKGTTLNKLELHDSVFSNGVEVTTS